MRGYLSYLSLEGLYFRAVHLLQARQVPCLLWSFGFGVWGLGCGVRGVGFGVWGLGFEV